MEAPVCATSSALHALQLYKLYKGGSNTICNVAWLLQSTHEICYEHLILQVVMYAFVPRQLSGRGCESSVTCCVLLHAKQAEAVKAVTCCVLLCAKRGAYCFLFRLLMIFIHINYTIKFE